jgi:S-adenosylmethionine synthetase
VTSGHPDKVCDQIADAILDAILAKDPFARVACEVTVCTDKIHIMGEVSSQFTPDYESVAREVVGRIGYVRPYTGFDASTCRVELDIHGQSPDIARGVLRRTEEDSGAGDQGMMFGYACRETESLMPLPITLANALTRRLEYVRRAGIVPCLLPDGKAQVTVEYDNGVPARISTVIVSAQHEEAVDMDTLRETIIKRVVRSALPASMLSDNTLFYVNPTGRFVIGGPAGDSGLTGRKIIADTYGGCARHGGGSFSGKDPTKVDRTGAYMARYIAKNVVAAGLASRCEVELAYAIGLADPVSVALDTFGTGEVPDELLARWVRDNVDMRPAMIIRRFDLRRPIYRQLSCYGHFGDNAKNMPWERTDLADALRTRFSSSAVCPT